jgi:hypothetical protein
MPDKSWKAFERRVARFFGCQDRNPLSGINGKHTASDTLHPELFIEAKQRQHYAIIRLWDEAKQLSTKEGKIPVIAISEKNRPGFWVLCHSSDLTAIANQRLMAIQKGFD